VTTASATTRRTIAAGNPRFVGSAIFGKKRGSKSVTTEETKEDDVVASDDSTNNDSTDNDDSTANDVEEDDAAAEIAALKKTIDELMTNVKSKQSSLSDINDKLKLNSANGYATLAADLQNFRKRREETSSKMKTTEVAGVLKSFMGTFKKFAEIREKFVDEDEDIQKIVGSYKALETSFVNEFTGIGAREFHAVEGEDMNFARLNKIGEEFSGEVAAGKVIREVTNGWEIRGEILEKAECVVSLGEEEEKVEEEEEEEEESEDSE